MTALLLIAKLSLVALSMLVATWASRRFGHRIGGLVAGFPIIMAPLIGLLLIDLSAQRVADICLATIGNLAACVAHIVTMAWLVSRFNWWQSLLGATLVFFTVSGLNWALPVPGGVLVALGLLSGLVAPRLMPDGLPATGGVPIPPIEFALRLVAAVGVTAWVMLMAGDAPAFASAMLLTYPINGSILPAFTRALYGAGQTRSLLKGFARGMRGLTLFLLATGFALPVLGAGLGYTAGVGCAAAYAIWLWRAGLRQNDVA